MEVFVEVAKSRSFSAAARRLALSNGSVTKHISSLEHVLGAQLLTRTTKSVSLTEAGQRVYESSYELLERYEQLEASIGDSVERIKGTLRVGTPPAFGATHLVPLINEFTRTWRDIQIVLQLDDGQDDLVKEGLDLSLRIAPSLRDTSYVAQRLTTVDQVLVASERYLAEHGHPVTPEDLARHDCLIHSLKSPTSVWSFEGPGGTVSAQVSGPVRANFGEALRAAAILGQGISMHPLYMVADDLHTGRLHQVLPDFAPVALAVFAVFPSRRQLPMRVRKLVEFLRIRLGEVSCWRLEAGVDVPPGGN